MIRSLAVLVEKSTKGSKSRRMTSSLIMKPWPKAMVESYGDYREEDKPGEFAVDCFKFVMNLLLPIGENFDLGIHHDGWFLRFSPGWNTFYTIAEICDCAHIFST